MKLRPIALLVALAVLAGSRAMALDNGVDPTNLGKGDWIWEMGSCESALGVSSSQGVVTFEKNKGMQWITVKGADGADTADWSQFNTTLISEAHAAGMKIFAWAYAYGNYYGNLSGEESAALYLLGLGADGLIIDAETEYQGQASAATAYCNAIRAKYPTRFLAYAPFPIIADHSSYPYIQFGASCNAVMPQDYWGDIGYSPAGMVSEMDSQWKSWQNGLAGTQYASSVKPIIPIGQGYNDSYYTDNGSDITSFINDLKNDSSPATSGGYKGVSTWSCQHHTSAMWSQLGAASIGTQGTDGATFVSKTLADNTVIAPGAAFSCAWTMKNSGTTTWGTGYTFNTNGGNTMGAPARTALSGSISPGSSTSITINFTAPSSAGTYTADFQMNNASGAFFGSKVSLTVIVATAPSITAPPTNEVHNPGDTARFTVAASGTTPLSFQWQKNGANISGATTTALSLSNVQLSDAADYSVIVTNVAGSVTSQSAVLTVTSTPYPNGSGTGLTGSYYYTENLTSLDFQRVDATVNFNWDSASPDPSLALTNYSVKWTGQVQPRYSQTYTFSTTTDDGARLWVNGVLIIDEWRLQSPTTWNGTIILTAGQLYNIEMDYYQNTGGAVAELSWMSASEAPAIIPQTQLYPTQPANLTPLSGLYSTGVNNTNGLLAGSAVDPHYTLIASADSSAPGPHSYVANPDPSGWSTNGPNSQWIAPQTNQSTGNLPGSYTYRLTFSLTGFDPTTASITGNWQTDDTGTDILLNGVSTGQSNPNGFHIFAPFSITNGFVYGANTLDFVVNNGGSADNATGLRVELSGQAAVAVGPTIDASPQDTSVNQGTDVTLSVAAEGTAPLEYQWFEDGTAIGGATNFSYTIPAAQTAADGSYDVVISNEVGAVTSSVAALTVIVPPSITTPPQSETNFVGDNVTFSVVAGGTSPFAYQWQLNGSPITGATDSSYALTSVQPTDAATYSVIVTNPAGSVTSSGAVLTIIVAPGIIAQPQTQSVGLGAPVTFTVDISGTAPFAYQWQFDGTNIVGATDSSYTLLDAQLTNGGDYSVGVTNAAGGVQSDDATLTVTYAPSVTQDPSDMTVQPSAAAWFNVSAVGSPTLTYQWQLNGNDIAGATQTTYIITNVGAGDFGLYSAVVSNAYGSASSGYAILAPSPFSASMNWNTFSGGGGTSVSTDGVWAVSGTIGHPETAQLAGNSWVMQGGFWGTVVGITPPTAGLASFSRAPYSSLTIAISDLLTNANDPQGYPLVLSSISATSTNGAAITTNATSIFYTPSNPDPNQADAFTYTVSDPFGNQASNQIFVTIQSSGGGTNGSLIITGITPQPDGSMQLLFSGTANQSYLIQATSDLGAPILWTTIATNQTDAGGLLQFTDTTATNTFARYYRVVLAQ